MEVLWWLDDEDANRHSWNGSFTSDPDVNNTDRPFSRVQDNLTQAYNAKHGTSYEVDDITWTQVPRPIAQQP